MPTLRPSALRMPDVYKRQQEHERARQSECGDAGHCKHRSHRKAEIATHGEDAHARALPLAGHEVCQTASLRMEHGHAQAAQHGGCDDERIAFEDAHSGKADSCQEHAERHEPGACVAVAQPAEPVSYTHLDVYKRQWLFFASRNRDARAVCSILAGRLSKDSLQPPGKPLMGKYTISSWFGNSHLQHMGDRH